MVDRNNQFKVLLSDDELEMVKDLSERKGLSTADFVRSLIRAEHQAARALEKRSTPALPAASFTASLAQAVGIAGYELGLKHKREAQARKKGR